MKFFTLIACLYLSVCCLGQAGTLNTQFNGGFVTTSFTAESSGANAIAVQPDGKVVAAGYTTISGTWQFALARYNTDGSLDQSFGLGGKVLINFGSGGGWIESIVIRSNGRIVVGGGKVTGTVPGFALMQFTAAGSPDASFGTNGLVVTSFGTSAYLKSLAIQSNGKIIAAGHIAVNVTSSDFAIVRYNIDGSLDNTFNGNGMVTGDIQGEDYIETVKIVGSGKILIAGSCGFIFNSPPGPGSKFCLARFSSIGIPDITFGTEGKVITDVTINEDFCIDIALQQNGKIIAAGSGEFPPFNYNITLVRYDQMGNIDNSFGTNGVASLDYQGNQEQARCLFVQSDNKIVVGGNTSINGGPTSFVISRFTAEGAPDNSFGNSGMTVTPIGTLDNLNAIAALGTTIYVAGIKAGPPDAFLIASYVNDATPLPVRFSSFTVQKQVDRVVLQWQTEFEQDVKKFVAEKSADGSNFTPFAEVQATGNSGVSNEYRTVDDHPFTFITYYRIRSVDLDGYAAYTKILYVKNEMKNIEVTPNPASSFMQVQLPGGIDGAVTVQLFDIAGRTVRSMKVEPHGNPFSCPLDISALNAGTYVLTCNGKGITFSRQIVKE